MRVVGTHLLLVVLLGASALHAQDAQPSAAPVRAHVARLADEALGGRQAGTEGERLAAEYIAGQLERMGARPLPGRASMFDTFEFTAGSRDGGSTIAVTTGPAGSKPAVSFSNAKHVQALSFSDDMTSPLTVNGVAGAPAVFAGYGLVVPETQGISYDSYAGLDVEGKVVVVLRYFPEDADPKLRAILARYSNLRYKAMAARQRGAAALVVVTGPRSPNAGETVPMGSDTAIAGSGIPAVSVDKDVADALFSSAPSSLEETQRALDTGNPHATGFDLPGVTVHLQSRVVRESRTARNVLAYLPATVPAAGDEKPWIVVGAHYDHLGRGEQGNSLATAADAGRAHVGADDNASGTAAVLAIGDLLASRPRQRHLLLAFWSAEEIGLVGSAAFTASGPIPASQIAAYLNFDMVGRMQDNKLTIQAAGTSPVWDAILERANVVAGFDAVVQDDPYQPTDVASFNAANVPSLSFTTGAHVDYHKPSDTADKINYEDLERVAELGAAIATRLMALDEPPQFTRVEQSSQTPTRSGIRIFTGTVPDYASTDKGLLLGDVIAGGPAETAGLRKGDVIVEIAGHSIANIYDYTYALDLLKVGEPVKVVFMRAGERHEAMLTPQARR